MGGALHDLVVILIFSKVTMVRGQGCVGDRVGNAELQGRQTPGVVSKSEKHFRSQHDTMMIAKARTKSFALSAINACALIIVSCCDRKCFSLFDTTPGAGGEKTLSDIKVTLLTEDTFFYDSNF